MTTATAFEPRFAGFAERNAAALATMPIVRALGLRYTRIEPGEVELVMPYDDRWTFREDQLQATPMFAIGDFAAISAGWTLLAEGWTVSTVDVTLKIVGPACAGPLRAVGRVVKAGRVLTVSAADIYGFDGRGESLCATVLATGRNLPPG